VLKASWTGNDRDIDPPSPEAHAKILAGDTLSVNSSRSENPASVHHLQHQKNMAPGQLMLSYVVTSIVVSNSVGPLLYRLHLPDANSVILAAVAVDPVVRDPIPRSSEGSRFAQRTVRPLRSSPATARPPLSAWPALVHHWEATLDKMRRTRMSTKPR
jgi:hypothetical protein